MTGNEAVFNILSKEILRLLRFYIATLFDLLKKLETLYQPIRSKTKTSRVFPRFA